MSEYYQFTIAIVLSKTTSVLASLFCVYLGYRLFARGVFGDGGDGGDLRAELGGEESFT